MSARRDHSLTVQQQLFFHCLGGDHGSDGLKVVEKSWFLTDFWSSGCTLWALMPQGHLHLGCQMSKVVGLSVLYRAEQFQPGKWVAPDTVLVSPMGSLDFHFSSLSPVSPHGVKSLQRHFPMEQGHREESHPTIFLTSHSVMSCHQQQMGGCNEAASLHPRHQFPIHQTFSNLHYLCETQWRRQSLDRKLRMIFLWRVFQSGYNHTLALYSAFYLLYRNKWQNSHDLQRDNTALSPHAIHYC